MAQNPGPGAPGNPYPPGTPGWRAYNYAWQKSGGKAFAVGMGAGGAPVRVFQQPGKAGTIRPSVHDIVGNEPVPQAVADPGAFADLTKAKAYQPIADTTPGTGTPDIGQIPMAPMWLPMMYPTVSIIPAITVTTSSFLALPRPPGLRTYLIIRSDPTSTGNLAIAFDNAASAATASLVLTPGGVYLEDIACPQNDIFLATVTLVATVTITFCHIPKPQ